MAPTGTSLTLELRVEERVETQVTVPRGTFLSRSSSIVMWEMRPWEVPLLTSLAGPGSVEY
jgi:hypothetical protein